MTDVQKNIIDGLLEGGNVASIGPGKWRLRDMEHNPIKSFGFSTWYKLKKLCRKNRYGNWVISLKTIRSLHGNHYAKEQYKKLQNEKRKGTNYGNDTKLDQTPLLH